MACDSSDKTQFGIAFCPHHPPRLPPPLFCVRASLPIPAAVPENENEIRKRKTKPKPKMKMKMKMKMNYETENEMEYKTEYEKRKRYTKTKMKMNYENENDDAGAGEGGAGACAAAADGAASPRGLPELPLHGGTADGRPVRHAQGMTAAAANNAGGCGFVLFLVCFVCDFLGLRFIGL